MTQRLGRDLNQRRHHLTACLTSDGLGHSECVRPSDGDLRLAFGARSRDIDDDLEASMVCAPELDARIPFPELVDEHHHGGTRLGGGIGETDRRRLVCASGNGGHENCGEDRRACERQFTVVAAQHPGCVQSTSQSAKRGDLSTREARFERLGRLVRTDPRPGRCCPVRARRKHQLLCNAGPCPPSSRCRKQLAMWSLTMPTACMCA